MAARGEHEIVDEWLRTWVHVRELTVTRFDGWPLVQVGSRTRETELVCVDPGIDETAALMRHVDGDPRAMLTVLAADVRPYLAIASPPGTRVDRDDETLMSAPLGPTIASHPGTEYEVRWERAPHRVTYVLESGGSIAAEGTVGVLGPVATFDQIETSPRFRRRGLGTHVMAALTAEAHERGATHGVLAASAPGRELYSALGWSPTLAMVSWMGA